MATIRKVYDGKVERVVLKCEGPSRVKQAFGCEVDINNIMSRYHKTGVLPAGRLDGRYGDVSGVGDYATCLQRVEEVHDLFVSLPAAVRDRMGNSPARLLEFLADGANRDEAVKLGLLSSGIPLEKAEVSAVVKEVSNGAQ